MVCSLWKRYLAGDIKDQGFGKLYEFVTYILATGSETLIYEYLGWIMSQDADLAMQKVF
jgi:hypothetical protein